MFAFCGILVLLTVLLMQLLSIVLCDVDKINYKTNNGLAKVNYKNRDNSVKRFIRYRTKCVRPRRYNASSSEQLTDPHRQRQPALWIRSGFSRAFSIFHQNNNSASTAGQHTQLKSRKASPHNIQTDDSFLNKTESSHSHQWFHPFHADTINSSTGSGHTQSSQQDAFHQHHFSQSTLDTYSLLKREVREDRPNNFIQNTKFKLILTTFCTACVVFELLETVMEQIPSFHKFAKYIMKLNIGILFLCITQSLQLLDDLLDKLEEQHKAAEESELEEQVNLLLQQKFATEVEAARAYDRAAVEIYAHAAHLNFIYPNLEKDENGSPPRKLSKYRGVKFVNQANAWQVDGTYLGY